MKTAQEQEKDNLEWATACAADFLRSRGHLIIDMNVSCPLKRQRRTVEVPLIAWEEASDTMAFIRVRTPSMDCWRNPTKRQRTDMGHAMRAWKRENRWHGEMRYDVLDVYGTPDEGMPVIDHVKNVKID